MAAKANDPQILCKGCNQHMGRLEWMQKKHCENPNCKCPEVQKLIQQTQNVISKAQERRVIIDIQRGAVPHGYDAEASNGQYVIPMPDVKVITVTPLKRK